MQSLIRSKSAGVTGGGGTAGAGPGRDLLYSEPVASSSAPRWYAADYHHPLPATGAYVGVSGYATLRGLRRGPESCRSRSRGSGRSSNRSLTRSEMVEKL